METRLLDRQWIERLLAEDAAGALKVLSDSAYQEAVSEVERPEDLERGLERALAETLTTVAAMSPDPELIDLFRLRWDFRTLRSLLKAHLLGVEFEEIGLTDGIGTVEVDVLAKAVQDEDMMVLPPALVDAARSASDAFRDRGELRDVDRVLDLALWAHQIRVASEHRDDFLIGYIRTEIDLLNTKTFMRMKTAGLDRSDLARLLVPGGTLEPSHFEALIGEPVDAFARSLEYGRYGTLAPVFRDWTSESTHALELACDNILLDYVENAKIIAYGIEPLVAFVLMRQTELKLVRAAVVAKLDGLTRDDIEGRLRSVHV